MRTGTRRLPTSRQVGGITCACLRKTQGLAKLAGLSGARQLLRGGGIPLWASQGPEPLPAPTLLKFSDTRDEGRKLCPTPWLDKASASKDFIMILARAADNTSSQAGTEISKLLHQGQYQQSKLPL